MSAQLVCAANDTARKRSMCMRTNYHFPARRRLGPIVVKQKQSSPLAEWHILMYMPEARGAILKRKGKVFMNNRVKLSACPRSFNSVRRRYSYGKRVAKLSCSLGHLIEHRTLRRGPLPQQISWRVSKICRCRSVSGNAALYAGHGHLFLHHETLE